MNFEISSINNTRKYLYLYTIQEENINKKRIQEEEKRKKIRIEERRRMIDKGKGYKRY